MASWTWEGDFAAAAAWYPMAVTELKSMQRLGLHVRTMNPQAGVSIMLQTTPFHIHIKAGSVSGILMYPTSDDAPSGWGAPFTTLPGVPSVEDTGVVINYNSFVDVATGDNGIDYPTVKRGIKDSVVAGNVSWVSPSGAVTSWVGQIANDVGVLPVSKKSTEGSTSYDEMTQKLGYYSVGQSGYVSTGGTDYYVTSYYRASNELFKNGRVISTLPDYVLGYGEFQGRRLCIIGMGATQLLQGDGSDWISLGGLSYPEPANSGNAGALSPLIRANKYVFSEDGSQASTITYEASQDSNSNNILVHSRASHIEFSISEAGDVLFTQTHDDLEVLQSTRFSQTGSALASDYQPITDSKMVIGVGYRNNVRVELSVRASQGFYGGGAGSTTVSGIPHPTFTGTNTEDISWVEDKHLKFNYFFGDVESDYIAYEEILTDNITSNRSVEYVDGAPQSFSSSRSDGLSSTYSEYNVLFADIKAGLLITAKTDLVDRNFGSISTVFNEVTSDADVTGNDDMKQWWSVSILDHENVTNGEVARYTGTDDFGPYSYSRATKGSDTAIAETPMTTTVTYTDDFPGAVFSVRLYELFGKPNKLYAFAQVDEFGNLIASVYAEQHEGGPADDALTVVLKHERLNIFPLGKTASEVLSITGTNQSLIKNNDAQLTTITTNIIHRI